MGDGCEVDCLLLMKSNKNKVFLEVYVILLILENLRNREYNSYRLKYNGHNHK